MRPADWATSGFGWGTLVPLDSDTAILTCLPEPGGGGDEGMAGRQWLACASITTPALEQGAGVPEQRVLDLTAQVRRYSQIFGNLVDCFLFFFVAAVLSKILCKVLKDHNILEWCKGKTPKKEKM